ncbi:MAG: hypothetical protein CVV44_02580 [Spirochaetae bacterium HGW-Spirochaetae-1]|jgi:PAS domain S-box-containing protein|nr:MAG: hypothetical protein CVV44_02580 [Spirochaetae bacterium HGW-Spirochaetae-1]
MFYLSLFAFFSCIAGLYFGIYVLRLNPRLMLNRLFFVIIICFAIWSFGYTFIYMARDRETAMFWYRISSIGWTAIPGVFLHFILIFTKQQTLTKKKWFFILLYTPVVLFLIRSMTGVLFTGDFIWEQDMILEVQDSTSPWYRAYMIYNGLCMTAAAGISLKYLLEVKSIRKKKQAKIVIVSLMSTMVIVYTFNIISVLMGLKLPVVGHLSFVGGLAGIWYAIGKYRLLMLSSKIASEKIISQMMDLVFLLDKYGNIVLFNEQVLNTLGYTSRELTGKPFHSITGRDIFPVDNRTGAMTNIELKIKRRSHGDIPVNISSSLITDEFDEHVGTVIVGHDIREKQELAQKNDIMEKELILAQKIQSSIIPRTMPVVDGVKIHAVYRSMAELGGDFFDFIKLRDRDMLGIFISDVSGHGVPAALITGMLKTLLDTAGVIRLDPADLLRYINNNITGYMGDNFLTAFYCIYNNNDRTLRYARAGHTYPFLIRHGEISRLISKGTLLGYEREINCEEITINLMEGDKILLYTDGLTEAVDRNFRQFEDTMPDILPVYGKKPVKEFVDGIYSELQQHRGDNPFEDDVLLIGLEVVP